MSLGGATTIIGCDPGAASGSIAILNINNSTNIEFFDIPTVTYMSAIGRKYKRPDRDKLLTLIYNLAGPNVAFFIIESQSGYGPIPGSTKFGLGNLSGLLVGMALSAKLSVEEVKSQTWKKSFDLHKTDGMSDTEFKELSRLKAIELFPATHEALRLKLSHNKAEALLIAEHGRRYILGKYIPGYQLYKDEEQSIFEPIEHMCSG